VLTFPNCKINLGLRVVQKRQDGYHNIETVFFPLPFHDILEMVPATGNGISFTNTGLVINGNTADNLCVKAYELLRKDFPTIPAVQLHLYKQIPAGAGLGGGSADGAFALQLLNKRFNLGLSTERLIGYALELGSDCPFFIINKPCTATSRGEELTPVELDLSNYLFTIVNPGIHVSTASVFSSIKPAIPEKPLPQIIKQPIATWRNELINDFEPGVFAQYPAIKEIKDQLYNKGAVFASMSGTGSTVYGIFEKDHMPARSFPKEYFTRSFIGQLQ
jgi:4-diphosphocytidyl-2-C-methyl-D-erythritol kinase